MIRIGYHGITWGSENFLKAVDDISGLGYRGFETFARLADDFEGRIDRFKEIMDTRGIQLVALYGGGELVEPAKADEVVERNLGYARFLQAAGADRLVLGGGTRKRGGNPDEDWQSAARVLDEIGRRCLDMGIKACYHPHLGTLVQTRQEVERIMEMTDGRYLFLCPDTAHLYKGGSDPAEVFRTYISRIAYVHFKDVNPEAKLQEGKPIKASERLPIFSELGTGPVDFPGVLSVLQASAYDGWITIELDSTTRMPKDSAEISKKYVEQVLKLRL